MKDRSEQTRNFSRTVRNWSRRMKIDKRTAASMIGIPKKTMDHYWKGDRLPDPFKRQALENTMQARERTITMRHHATNP